MRGCVSRMAAWQMLLRAGSVPSKCVRFGFSRRTRIFRSIIKIRAERSIDAVEEGLRAIAGEKFTDWLNDAAVLGLWEVIKKYGYFREKFHETLDEIGKNKPDAVVLIDYPGFNLRLARALRKQPAKGKIIYYISPQVW